MEGVDGVLKRKTGRFAGSPGDAFTIRDTLEKKRERWHMYNPTTK